MAKLCRVAKLLKQELDTAHNETQRLLGMARLEWDIDKKEKLISDGEHAHDVSGMFAERLKSHFDDCPECRDEPSLDDLRVFTARLQRQRRAAHQKATSGWVLPREGRNMSGDWALGLRRGEAHSIPSELCLG